MDLGYVFVGLVIFGICYGIREVALYFMDKRASHKILANWSRYKMLAKEKTLNLDVCTYGKHEGNVVIFVDGNTKAHKMRPYEILKLLS